jgi:hypothetical protein
MTRRDYGNDTYLTYSPFPFAEIIGGAALCSDGTVRKLKRVSTPDTFFSAPAAVSVKGKTVTGFLILETLEGFSTEGPDDPITVKFVANQYGKNGHLLAELKMVKGN